MLARSGVNYKRSAIRAAKELHYGKEVINKLKKASSDDEITRIMLSARRNDQKERC
jgi:hypothetical protein